MIRLLQVTAAAALVTLLAGCGVGEPLGRESQLFILDVESRDRRPLGREPDSYSSPSWSEDGQRLAVVSSGPESGAIEVVDAEGAEKRVVVRKRGFIQGAAWSPQGATVAYVRLREPAAWTLETVDVDGASRRVIGTHQSDRVASADPSWSPNGSSVAYTGGDDTFLVPTKAGGPRLLLADAWAPRWSPNGRFVLLTTRDALVTAPVDGSRPKVVVAELIDAHAAWSPSSARIAFSGVTRAGDRRYHLYLVSVGSKRIERVASEVVADAPAWSPDGRSLAFATWNGSVRVITLASGETRTLTQLHDAEIRDLAWSPDGNRLAFVARDVPED